MTREQELIELLSSDTGDMQTKSGFICRVIVTNEVPAHYKVSITGIATDFDYRDGTTYRDINDPINVPTGGFAQTESNDSTKCVKSTFIGIKVVQQGFEPTVLVTREDAPSQDQCLVEVPIKLYLSSAISEADLKEGILKNLVLKALS